MHKTSYLFFFFKQKTAYEMRISDASSDVCSSDLATGRRLHGRRTRCGAGIAHRGHQRQGDPGARAGQPPSAAAVAARAGHRLARAVAAWWAPDRRRSDERRGGEGWVSKCRSRWPVYYSKQKTATLKGRQPTQRE